MLETYFGMINDVYPGNWDLILLWKCFKTFVIYIRLNIMGAGGYPIDELHHTVTKPCIFLPKSVASTCDRDLFGHDK